MTADSPACTAANASGQVAGSSLPSRRTRGVRSRSGSASRYPNDAPFGQMKPLLNGSASSPRTPTTAPPSRVSSSPQVASHSGQVRYAVSAIELCKPAVAPQAMREPQQLGGRRRMSLGSVRSGDGTTIAFERSGEGPPVILVGGAFQDRGSLAPLAAELAPSLTVYCYDRRGRGGSGDTPPYAVGREVDDLRALVAEAGGTAALFGVSSGAILALEAAAGAPVTKVAAFEPPYTVDDGRPPQSAALAGEVAELIHAGRPGDAVELFLGKGVGLPPEQIAQMRGMYTSMLRGL